MDHDDAPATMEGQAGKVMAVNVTEDAFEFIAAGGGGAFTDLSDVPAAYTGAGGKIVAVKADVSGLEFVAAPAAANGIPAGGTTGQILAKVDGDDYDVEWIDPAAGSSPLTTKGDVYVYGAADARLPVGTNGQVLTADSAQALGVKWADAGDGASPSGDGTDDTCTQTLAEAGSAYSPVFNFIEILDSFWLEKVKLYCNDGGVTTINVRSGGGELLATGSFTPSGAGWYTATLDTPIYLKAMGYYCIEYKMTTAVKPWRKTSYLYSGTLWKMLSDRVTNFFTGSSYSETPGMGLIEYDDTP